jgi:ferritin
VKSASISVSLIYIVLHTNHLQNFHNLWKSRISPRPCLRLDIQAAVQQQSGMEKDVIQAVEKQATHELYAAQSYLALAYWSDVRQYSGFAEFFHEQVEEEREHADKFLKFLADRDIVPTIGQVGAPRSTFKDLGEVAKFVYDLERTNTAGINAAYKTALTANDYATQVMLHWFINEQVEEEAWTDKLLVKVQEATCPGALHMLDHHIVKELKKKASTP